MKKNVSSRMFSQQEKKLAEVLLQTVAVFVLHIPSAPQAGFAGGFAFRPGAGRSGRCRGVRHWGHLDPARLGRAGSLNASRSRPLLSLLSNGDLSSKHWLCQKLRIGAPLSKDGGRDRTRRSWRPSSSHTKLASHWIKTESWQKS